MIKKAALAVLFLLFLTTFSFSQSNVRFSKLSIKDGLSQSSVNTILQDKQGFMWFGTQDGLNFYDGYRFTIYKHDPENKHSISENFIHALFEDKKGILWIGTDGGLNLFDKATQKFTTIHSDASDRFNLSHNSVWSIYQDKKKNIWIGTEDGILHKLLKIDSISGKAEFQKYDLRISSSFGASNPLYQILEDEKGYLWIASGGNGLTRFDPEKERFINYQSDPGNKYSLPDNTVWCLLKDSKGTFWAGTNNGLSKFDRDKGIFTNYINQKGNNKSLSGNSIRSIHEDKSGTIWIGTEDNGLNVFNVKKGEFSHSTQSISDPNSISSNSIYSIFEDRQGTLWFGTENGLSKFDRFKQNFKHFSQNENDEFSLSSNSVWSIFEDKTGILWVGVDDGLNMIDRKKDQFKKYSLKHLKNNPPNESIYSLYGDNSNNLWIGSDEGLCLLDRSKQEIVKFNSKDNLSNAHNSKRVYCIFEDSKGNLWTGTKEGLLILDSGKNKFELFKHKPEDKNSLGNNVVRVIREDKNGNIWIGTNGGGLNKVVFNSPGLIDQQNISFIRYKNKNIEGSINNNIILSILIDNSSDKLWLGTYGGGLNEFDISTGKAVHFTEKNGLSNNVVYSVLPDKTGNLWMSTNKGISSFNLKNKSFRNYFENDGLQSNEFNIGAYFKSNSGEIFMGGINGFNAFFPDKIRKNPIPPQIAITDFQIFNRSVKIDESSVLKQHISLTKDIILSYKENLFSFEFAALHYSFPEKNAYAYFMEGVDEEWNYVGNRKIAIYTKLDAGDYVFKVKGANSDGVWSEETSINIKITPPFWKTWWFRILASILVLGLAFGWYKTRIMRIEQQKAILEQQVAERTAKVRSQKEEIEKQKALIEVEKDKVEKLLLNILPVDTAEELKTKGKASARHYRLASVMFTDFVGFTQIAEQLRPKELIAELDRYFIQFDEIIEKYGIEKIKTIGDSYMCAGGLPIRNKSNPVDIVLAGLEIQRFMNETIASHKTRNEKFWELRIGIHTGELIAGVVGTKRFAYDIWGDTVNVASRMEAGAEPGKVNISGSTYEMASEFFVCTYRGKIQAKNKGEIDMYYVERIRPELSIDELGIEPNDAFERKMAHVLYSKILYKKAEHYIIKLLKSQLPEGLFYHGIHHTIDVCDAAEKIAFLEGIEGEDVFLLKTAALFHDAGFTKEYTKNEEIGVQMSEEILPQYGYSDEQIKTIAGIIYATQVPQNPQTHLEQIMCDADLDYLGRDDFHEIADTLKKELMAFGKITSERQWDEMQIGFLEKHKYFTKSSIQLRGPKKAKHIQEIKARLMKGEYVS